MKNVPPKKIYTCATVAFKGNPYFFTRDAGLVCRCLQAAGVESRAIMPLPAQPADVAGDLMRVAFSSLISPRWWKSLGLDGVVLYSWAAPRYLLVARAIRKAGIPLSIHLDWSGLPACKWDASLPLPRRLYHWLKGFMVDVGRRLHLQYADWLTTFPAVAENLRNSFFYGPSIAEKCRVMPCPVHPSFIYDGREKRNVMICVGRWDDERQKRSRFLMDCLNCFYASGSSTETEIYGKLTDEMRAWHAGLSPEVQQKIHLVGFIDNAVLGEVYKSSRVIFCTSSFEGSHNVSGEALCCGASVVTTNRFQLACVKWYTTEQSGTVSAEDSPESLAAALHVEMEAWDSGRRDPWQISRAWIPRLHAATVFSKIFNYDLK